MLQESTLRQLHNITDKKAYTVVKYKQWTVWSKSNIKKYIIPYTVKHIPRINIHVNKNNVLLLFVKTF